MSKIAPVAAMVTMDDPVFEWQIPSVARFERDSSLWVRRALRWADNIAQGKDDLRQYRHKDIFVPGGTIGPAPATRRHHIDARQEALPRP